MAAICSEFNLDTRYASFIISNPTDISKLPTNISAGTNELQYVNSIVGGDAICLSSSEVYMLDPEDSTWKILE